MKNRWRIQLALLAVAALMAFGAAIPVAATTSPHDPAPIVRQYEPQQAAGSSDRPGTPVIWAVIGVAAASAIGGVLYLLKREVGGFPSDPDWIAPISILRSGESPIDVDDFDEPPEDQH